MNASHLRLSFQNNFLCPVPRYRGVETIGGAILIRTQTGPLRQVNKLSYQDAYSQNITTSTLLLSMNDINIDVACEARFALERSQAIGLRGAAKSNVRHVP